MGSDREMASLGMGRSQFATCGPIGAYTKNVGSLQPWGSLQVWSRAGEHGRTGVEETGYKVRSNHRRLGVCL